MIFLFCGIITGGFLLVDSMNLLFIQYLLISKLSNILSHGHDPSELNKGQQELVVDARP